MGNRTVRETVFPASLAHAGAVRAFVDGACESWGIARASGYKLHLIVEELFTNTVKHGHRGDSNFPVWIRLECADEHLALTFIDQATPFNPIAHAADVNVESGAAEHRVGGLGVLLVCELAQYAEYAYVFGRNRIKLKVQK
jgi:serine/threonine-protein kinase RsbW